jgi:hypothetical protein
MDFSVMAKSIMPEVESGGTDPMLIYRDAERGWQWDFTHNQYGDEFDWVQDVKERDPFAVTVTGKDFSNGSYPFVYDTILTDRLRAEYTHMAKTGAASEQALLEYNALYRLFEDHAAEFSPQTAAYLPTLDKPLAALRDLCGSSVRAKMFDRTYSDDLVSDSIDRIENAVAGVLRILARREHIELAAEIEKAINEVRTPGEMAGTAYFDMDKAYKSLTERFGADKINAVLADVVLFHHYDGRYSAANKEWAQSVAEPFADRDYAGGINTHPTILNGLIDKARKSQAEREKKPSLLGRLEEAKRAAAKDAAERQAPDKARGNGVTELG